jgi:formylglycine-generating enzyme required for sulfatase activity
VAVDGLWIDRHPVTNAQFRRFVKATGYVTVAEQPPDPADFPDADPDLLVPGALVFQPTTGPVDLRNWRNWWAWVPGADWRHPEGPGSTLHGRDLHPVVQVCHGDAQAYADWAGKALPTEAEWEHAARGGLEAKVYTWGDEFAPRGRQMANTWQGEFPWQNLLLDRYERTSPVGSFPPNGYGLHDMAGNVWEWTTDWYQEHDRIRNACCTLDDPRGGERDGSHDPRLPDIPIPRKVMKGGSYLCAPNYCRRYRPAARMAQPVDTATCHLGFRCILRTGPAA